MKTLVKWGLLLLVVLGLLQLASYFSLFIDKTYVAWLYYFLNRILTFSLGKIPFSVGDILYGIALFYIVYKLILLFRTKENRWRNLITFLLKGCTVFLLGFNLSWGLNNYRTPLHQQLQFPLEYNTADLEVLTQLLINRINALHTSLVYNPEKKVVINDNISDFYESARIGYAYIKHDFRLPVEHLQHPHYSLYSYPLTKMGFSGYFNPFTHEAQVNHYIPNISLPITTAHEMAHQLGIAKESEANFIAFMVMRHQPNQDYQYAAYLYAVKYCLKAWRGTDEKKFLFYQEQLHQGIIDTITETELFWLKNKNASSALFKVVYGNFLKINNQKDGMKSYNRFIDLLINYQKKKPFL